MPRNSHTPSTVDVAVPRDRDGKFSTRVFERYQRSEKALVLGILQMYIEGVSTRRVKRIAERLCGHEFSASAVSELAKGLDEELEKFARRRLEEEYVYLILDARVEKVGVNGVVQNAAVHIAVGIDMDGRRRVLGVELAGRETRSSWREFLILLRQRGLGSVRAPGVGGRHPQPLEAMATSRRAGNASARDDNISVCLPSAARVR
ncbi:MAG: transposase [Armatimonadetes bacterium]|nr:transposase [Armatimonadota bacterium]